MRDQRLLHEARAIALPWQEDYSRILQLIGDARYVLLGEMSHGTHEFYKIRAEISKKLIQEKQFQAIAVEADWPDSIRVNRYLKGTSKDSTATEALSEFKRFPQWMWRNADVLDLIGWMRSYNDQLDPGKEKVGFYGLDLYSLRGSIAAVLQYLSRVDPEAARRARYRYSCFDHFGEDPQSYGYAAQFDLQGTCEDEVLTQLIDLRRRAADYAQMDGRIAADEYFFAEQNARVIKNAENYYRIMFQGHIESWNLRDTHMMETLLELSRYFSSIGIKEPRIIVWAHNSHLGDARATEMGRRGELNLGELVRKRFAKQAFSIGFSTFSGSVTAASEWDGVAERKRVRPSLPDSYEATFHELDIPRVLFAFRDQQHPLDTFRRGYLQRAIGVIYKPETERLSHYFRAILPDQFDAMLHIDQTRAVEPLETTPEWHTGEAGETFPTGL
jgi:erythromycin esterase-like protein